MKTLVLKALMAAAVVAAMAGVASAQNLKADIPFSFTAGGTVLPPGEYQISRDGAGALGTLRLVNAEAGRVATLLSTSRRQTGALAPSNLIFKCGDGACALVRIITPYWAYDVSAPKQAGGANTLATIRLSR
jgi:hypothetical protein